MLTLAGFAGCSSGEDGSNATPRGVNVVVRTPTPDTTNGGQRTPTATPGPTPTPLRVCGENPDPAPPSVLQIEEPKSGDRIRVPFHLRGWGANIRANNGVALGVVDSKQTVIQVSNLPPLPVDHRLPPSGLKVTNNTAPFAADVVLSNVRAPTPFCLWVYLEATDEGHPRGVVQVPVIVEP